MYVIAFSSTIHDLLLIENNADDYKLKIGEVYSLNLKKNGFVTSLKNSFKILKNYDGILVHAVHPVAVLPLFFLNKKILFFQHGMAVSHGPFAKRLLKKVFYSIMPPLLKAKVICSTSFAKKKLRDKNIYLKDSIIRIVPFGLIPPNKSYPKTYEPQKRKIQIGLAGRFVPQKRFDLVLKSFYNYQGRMKYIINIAGDGPEESLMKDLANNIKCENVEVNFLGRINNMETFYSKLDLFILPSKEESFGLVILEALFHCVPVAVFSDVGGALTLIEHENNGFILENINKLEQLWNILSENPKILYKQYKFIEQIDMSDFHITNTRIKLDDIISERI